MILINTEIANLGTRTDLAIFNAMRYKEICIQGHHEEPEVVVLTRPDLALKQPIAIYWNDRNKISSSWRMGDDILHHIKFYHPYAEHPIHITVNQRLIVVALKTDGQDYSDVVSNTLVRVDPVNQPPLDLVTLMNSIYTKFPTTPDESLINVRVVMDRHTLKRELVVVG